MGWSFEHRHEASYKSPMYVQNFLWINLDFRYINVIFEYKKSHFLTRLARQKRGPALVSLLEASKTPVSARFTATEPCDNITSLPSAYLGTYPTLIHSFQEYISRITTYNRLLSKYCVYLSLSSSSRWPLPHVQIRPKSPVIQPWTRKTLP